MNNNYPFINREISNVAFNQRVLYEATDDESVPLLERLKFVAIFSSNMDEFYMIRVAGLFDQLEAGYAEEDRSGMKPLDVLNEIEIISKALFNKQSEIFKNLIKNAKRRYIIFQIFKVMKFMTFAESIFLDEIFAFNIANYAICCQSFSFYI